MTIKMKKRRAASLPGKWFRSIGGTVCEVTRTTERNRDGERLFRCRYEEGVRGSQRFTADELMRNAKRWLKNRPRGWGQY